MIGIDLTRLDAPLTRVAPEHAVKPVRSFDAVTRMGEHVRDYMVAVLGSDDVERYAADLPHQAFRRLTRDELAKVIMSSNAQFVGVERDRHDADPVNLALRKIRNSLWKWSLAEADWNEMVDAYDGIRAFDLGVDGFTATLDVTTGHNERGASTHARVWLDGVFAFLVHWKGEHVATLGFSFAEGRRLLVQQIQNVRARGNRWMFRLPANRVEHVVSRFVAAFPRHAVHIADGAQTSQGYLDDYRREHAALETRIAELRRRLGERMPATARREIEAKLDEDVAFALQLAGKIATLERERRRLKALYAETGRFTRGDAYRAKGIRHYALAA